MKFIDEQYLRKDARMVIKSLELHIKDKQKVLEEQRQKMYLNEEKFFCNAVGLFLKSKQNRFFHILKFIPKSESYYINCPLFVIDFYDLGVKELHKEQETTCYNVFGHDFELKEITLEEFMSNLNNKNLK